MTEQQDTNGTPRPLGLIVRNVMNVKLVRLDFDPAGGLTIIGGKNGAGKTSTLTAVSMLLGGGKAQVAEPIRRGQERAEVIMDLEAFVAKRVWTKDGGSHLTVKTKDGATYKSPQALLNGFLGAIGVDPLAFTTMDAKKQAEVLRALVDIDFAEADAKYDDLFEKRTATGRHRDQLAGELSGIPYNPEAPEEVVSLADLLAERTAMLDGNATNDAVRRDHAENTRELNASAEVVERYTIALASAKSALHEANNEAEQARLTAEASRAAVDALKDADLTETEAKLKSLDLDNAACRQAKTRANVAGRHDAARDEYEEMTHTLKGILASKTATIAAAKFPIEGLGFSEDGMVTFDDLPFSQASSADQLRASTGILVAMNPKLKFLLIDNGEKLDSDGRQLLRELAAEHHVRILMTCVGEEEGFEVVIEDGEIVGDAAAEPVGAAEGGA